MADLTDEEKIRAVTDKLTTSFYVGQEVRIFDPGYVGAHWQGGIGVVRGLVSTEYGLRLGIDMGERSDGDIIIFELRSVKPL